MESINLKFTLTKEDCIKTLRLITFRRRRIMHIFLVGLAIFIGIMQAFADMSDSTIFWNWLLIAIIIAGVVYEYVLHPIAFARRLEKLGRLPTEITLSVDENSVDSASRLDRVRTGWDTYNDVYETEDYFFLAHAEMKGLVEIIPKRAFESEEQAQAFRELAEGQIKG